MTVIYTCIFLLGAAVASFLNATLYRIENKYKYPAIIKSGSECENCKHLLKWWELMPILGYILIKGRCSKCKEGVNIYYPFSELILGTIFLLFFLFTISWYIWVTIILLFILSYYDIKEQAVYRTLVHIFLVYCFLIFLIFLLNPSNLILPTVFSLLLLILNIIKKSFGLGDILVLFGLGILISWQQYIVLFWLAITLALLYSLVLIVVKRIDIKGAKIAMLPFFSLSFVVTTLWGFEIFSFLLKFMRIW